MTQAKKTISVIKVGGDIVENAESLNAFLFNFIRVEGYKVLVHGGGKVATTVAEMLGFEVEMIDGRRVTDEKMRQVVQGVYGGIVNKNIVAKLQCFGCDAIGLTGADVGLLKAHKRAPLNGVDYGFVGEVDKVEIRKLITLLESGFTPVIAPLTWDQGQKLLNTNADTIARDIASSIASETEFESNVYFGFGHSGVMRDMQDPESRIKFLDYDEYLLEKSKGVIAKGMIPKLDNGFTCLKMGVSRVTIGAWNKLASPEQGTNLILKGEQNAGHQ